MTAVRTDATVALRSVTNGRVSKAYALLQCGNTLSRPAVRSRCVLQCFEYYHTPCAECGTASGSFRSGLVYALTPSLLGGEFACKTHHARANPRTASNVVFPRDFLHLHRVVIIDSLRPGDYDALRSPRRVRERHGNRSS